MMATDDAIDAIYVNGKIVTVDASFTIAEAFAVSRGRFRAIGTSQDIRQLARASTRVVDLQGCMVLPGIIDSHPHTILRGLGAMAKPSLFGLHSISEIAAAIARTAAEKAPGTWIVSTPIGDPPDYFHLPERLEERRWPTRADLDKVAPKNPVYIPTSPYWPHPSIFNSTALSRLGITHHTADEPGIRIEKDAATGEPTGLVHGLSIYNRVPLYSKLISLVPELPHDLQLEGIRRAIKQNIERGVTALYEAHVNFSAPLMQELRNSGGLMGRVVSTCEVPTHLSVAKIDEWMAALTDAAGAGAGDDFCKLHGVTVSMDGASQFGTALMREPYLNPYGQMSNGSSAVSTEKLAEIARLAAKRDIRLNIVIAGNKATDMCIEALETVNREIPIAPRRWVVQHIQHPTQDHIHAVKKLGMVVTTYSSIDFSKGAETLVKRLGGDLWKSVVPLRWWIDAGVKVAQSTDGAHFDPMFTIWESLVRLDGRTGESLLTPAKTITRPEAIRLYTINAAHVLCWEDRIGSIEAGKLADFVVLDKDILTCPVDEIRETKVLLTVINGEILHDRNSLSP